MTQENKTDSTECLQLLRETESNQQIRVSSVQSVPKVAWRLCFCNVCLQTSVICHCFTKTLTLFSIASAGSPIMCLPACPWPPGLIWSRYSLVIIPKNWNLFCVNFFVGGAGASQLYRIWRFVVHRTEPSPAADRGLLDQNCFNNQFLTIRTQ